MNKLWIIALAALVAVPALGAATPIVTIGPVTEQLVEGHTVFTVLEVVTQTNTTRTQFAAAVAVLVRQASAVNANERFPGVLWFNDQYLTDPVDNAQNNVQIRYPCVGAVQAVNQGSLPAGATPTDLWTDPTLAPTAPTYAESYMITDPNDHQWNVDKWSATTTAATFPVWTVAMEDNQAGYDSQDDGVANCDPYVESSTAVPVSCGPYHPNFDDTSGNMSLGGGGTVPSNHCQSDQGPGSEGSPSYPTPGATCDNGGSGCDLKYNAVLYFYLEDLTVAGAGVKDHCSFQENAAPPTCADANDASGCQVNTDPIFPDQWPCPSGDDNAEGNSHPYNPFNGLPICPNCVGRGNHGGSDVTPPGSTEGTNSNYRHATRLVDIYYGHNPAPGSRGYRVLDAEGSTAPYFCEDGFTSCIPGDL